ncbi:hypothetical protein [uncultured Tateyamaria sp.]|uniref:hypothetical protein n=1 Tax=uncultured Tateyamaria sp. TaxID=455651 RepID=UPI002609314F|nr:hypothetical protein [uncultured Tateyamaria sp.]
MDWSWTELQALGVKAASGAGVPAAQALAFGAMLPRHLADGGAEDPLIRALESPTRIVTLALQIEEMVERASITLEPVRMQQADAGRRALMISWLAGLPCQSEVSVSGTEVRAALSLAAPSKRGRPKRISVSEQLATQLRHLAERTYVPDSDASRNVGAGAGLMDLD